MRFIGVHSFYFALKKVQLRFAKRPSLFCVNDFVKLQTITNQSKWHQSAFDVARTKQFYYGCITLFSVRIHKLWSGLREAFIISCLYHVWIPCRSFVHSLTFFVFFFWFAFSFQSFIALHKVWACTCVFINNFVNRNCHSECCLLANCRCSFSFCNADHGCVCHSLCTEFNGNVAIKL